MVLPFRFFTSVKNVVQIIINQTRGGAKNIDRSCVKYYKFHIVYDDFYKSASFQIDLDIHKTIVFVKI